MEGFCENYKSESISLDYLEERNKCPYVKIATLCIKFIYVILKTFWTFILILMQLSGLFWFFYIWENPVCCKEHMHRLTEGELTGPASHFTATTTELSGGRGEHSLCAENKK